MKKQYARKQIVEAINYWKNQLAKGNYINEDDNSKDSKTNPAETFLKGAVKKFNDQKVDPKNWQKLDDLLWEEMQNFVKEYGSSYNLKLHDFAIAVDRMWMQLYDKGEFSNDKIFMALGDSTRQMIIKSSK